MIIDTHAHLFFPNFEPDLDLVLDCATQAGLRVIINVGDDLKTSQEALKQAENFSSQDLALYSTVGSHPHEALRLATLAQGKPSIVESIRQNMEQLERAYRENPAKVIAIGECGLDYFFEGNNDFTHATLSQEELINLQKELFKAHIALAKKLNLPLIIHCRDAWHNIFVPELSGTTGVFHSFTGDESIARKALNLGFYLGFSCMITYPKNDYLRQIIQESPVERLLIETDSPFLPPQTQRGKRNEPANVVEVVKTIAQIKGLSAEEIAEKAFKNAQRLFKLT